MAVYKVSWEVAPRNYLESLVDADSPQEAIRLASPGDIDKCQFDELELIPTEAVLVED